MRWYRFARTIELPAPPDRVWPLLAQTDLLNREMGLPLPEFTYSPRPEGGTSIEAEATVGPLRLAYEEHPFDWVRPHFYSVRRTFRNGPFRNVVGRVNLEARGSGTQVTTHVEIETSRLGGVAAMAFARRSMQAFLDACEGFRMHMEDPEYPAYPRESTHPPADPERLRLGRSQMGALGFDAEADALARFLTTAPAAEAALFRPTRFMAEFGRRRAIEMCLAATRVGWLDMNWRVMCPYCRSNREVHESLGTLNPAVHCRSCAISFDAGFDSNVEVLFSAAFGVRPVVRASYCIGGPQLAPHVVAQVVLAPGEQREGSPAPPPGRYRLVSLQAPVSVAADSELGLAVTLATDGLSAHPASAWRFFNRLTVPAVVRVERIEATDEVVTAAEITAMAAFRDQFSSEVLSPGVEIAVRQAALLFTDLRGSTRMYRDRGDAPSYAEVRRHFELVASLVAEHGGGIVKTIGDAVMAAFHDPVEAVRAALEIQRRERSLTVRIGVHAGPALAVNANDRLDYFGRTVNLAARLEKHSQGGDVIVSETLLQDPRVAEATVEIERESFCAPVADIDEAMRLVRLRPKPC